VSPLQHRPTTEPGSPPRRGEAGAATGKHQHIAAPPRNWARQAPRATRVRSASKEPVEDGGRRRVPDGYSTSMEGPRDWVGTLGREDRAGPTSRSRCRHRGDGGDAHSLPMEAGPTRAVLETVDRADATFHAVARPASLRGEIPTLGEVSTMQYRVVRPSDGEVLSRFDNPIDAEEDALTYAGVDEESILVIREVDGVSIKVPLVISVAHPSGALFRTTGNGGRVGSTQQPQGALDVAQAEYIAAENADPDWREGETR
jgi:hypothetical protein